MLTDSELSILETLHDILKPLSFLTDALGGEKEVTVSAMIPVLKHIKWKLTVDNANDTMLAAEVKEIIWSAVSFQGYRIVNSIGLNHGMTRHFS